MHVHIVTLKCFRFWNSLFEENVVLRAHSQRGANCVHVRPNVTSINVGCAGCRREQASQDGPGRRRNTHQLYCTVLNLFFSARLNSIFSQVRHYLSLHIFFGLHRVIKDICNLWNVIQLTEWWFFRPRCDPKTTWSGLHRNWCWDSRQLGENFHQTPSSVPQSAPPLPGPMGQARRTTDLHWNRKRLS